MELPHNTLGDKPSLMMQTIQTFASMFGFMFINVFSAVILSRGLTPDDRGVYLGITLWNGFIFGLCDIGIYMATIYLWGKSKEQDRRNVFTTLLVWALGTSLICILTLMLCADWIIKDHLDGTERFTAYLFFASSVGGPLTSLLSGILAAQQRFSMINLIRVGLPAILTTFWLSYFMFGTLSIAMCLATTSVIPSFGLILLIWQTRVYFKSLGRFRFSIFRQAFWYGLRSHGGSVMNVLGNSTSQLMVFALTPSALAYYQTASSATGVIWAIPLAIGVTSFPNMVKEDSALLHKKLCRYFRLTALSTLVGVILLGLAEPVLIPLLFGSLYVSAIIPGIILLPGALFGGLSNLLGGALSSTGRTLHNTVADLVLVGTTLGVMMLTLSNWGIIGAALSALAGSVMNFVVRLLWYNICIQRISVREITPGRADLRELLDTGLGIYRRVNGKMKRRLST
jgi:O-antigen/teichoic acid export membrane protein